MKRLVSIFAFCSLNTIMTIHSLFLDNSKERYEDPFKGLTFSFSCDYRPAGFYADVEHDCRIFHVCDGRGGQIPVLCPYYTLFDQRQGMCSDEKDILCDQSEKWYYLDDSNYYSYFMEPKKEAEVVLEDIEVYTVIPLGAD